MQSPYILVIDDNPLAIKLVTCILSELQYECLSASNGKEAFLLLQKHKFSLVICDVNMPVMNGYDFVKEFRSNRMYDAIPLIVISSDDNEDNVVRIINLGADDFLAKPLQEKLFISKVRAVIQKSQIKANSRHEAIDADIIAGQFHLVCCTDASNIYFSALFSNVNFQITYVTNSLQLFEVLHSQDNSLICVDSCATWLVACKEHVMQFANKPLPIVFFIEEHQQDLLIVPYSGVFYKHFSYTYIISQIEFLCVLQKKNKGIVVSNIKQALSDTSFIFEKFVEKDADSCTMSLFHENYEEIPGGDFYEIFSLHDNRYSVIFMGDIMGKSWNAWLFVPIYLSYIRSTIKFLSERNITQILSTPHKIIKMLNSYCVKDIQLLDMFTTLSLVVFDNVDKKMHVASAGGMPPLYYSALNKKVSECQIFGNLLGIDDDSLYTTKSFDCSAGDVLFLYSDGYSEAFIKEKQAIVGRISMISLFTTFVSSSLQTTLDFESEYINTFDVQEFNDDRTLLILRVV